MPYASIADLPPAVKERYSPTCQRVFLNAYDRAAENVDDEEGRFKVAHTAAGMCKDAGKSARELPELAVKSVGEGVIEGLAIPFGGRDLEGETFTKNTDFCLDWFDARPLLYDHGEDGAVKTTVVGRVIEHEMTEEGLWAKAQLDRRNRYTKVIEGLVAQGALSFSSGAMPRLVLPRTKGGEITRWPYVELSLTPIPAEPTRTSVYAVKSVDWVAHLSALEGDSPPAGESYALHFDRVLAEAKAFVDRSDDLVSIRAKAGRVLSAANRERLSLLRERISESASQAKEVIDDLDELLKNTDPAAEKKAIEALIAAAAEQEARLQDVLRN